MSFATGTTPMGSSFTEYRGAGFWARDPALEVWLRLLVDEIDRLPTRPDWLQQLRNHWHLQATAGLVGCISAGLDEWLTSEDRRSAVVELSELAVRQLREHGATLSRDLLNSLQTGGAGSGFTADVESEFFERVGSAFCRLLNGRLKTDHKQVL